MNPDELEQLLLKNLKLAKENNAYLQKIDRRQRWAINLKIFYWLLIIGLALAGYYYAFPYLQTAKSEFNKTWESISSLVSFTGQGN